MPHVSEVKTVFEGDLYRPMFPVVLDTKAGGRSRSVVQEQVNNKENVEHTTYNIMLPQSPGGQTHTHFSSNQCSKEGEEKKRRRHTSLCWDAHGWTDPREQNQGQQMRSMDLNRKHIT